MAISRMQQPRQMYGLGSFVKKLTRKVTRPFTKVARKIVPKEIAGIMRLAAPFLGPVSGPAAYLLGTAKQTGRISPVDLALIAAPKLSKINLPESRLIPESMQGNNLRAIIGNLEVPLSKNKTLREVLVGDYSITPDKLVDMGKYGKRMSYKKVPGSETSGIFGKGGEMFKFGQDKVGLLDTKVGQTLFGKPEIKDGKPTGSFVPSFLKIGSTGVSLASLIKDAKTPDEAGEALVAATGDSADYDKGYALFSQLTPELFNVPEEFRMNVKDGGIMRTNYARGSDDDDDKPVLPEDPTKPINPFGPKPIKPLGDMKMAEFNLKDYMEEFERVFPEMIEKRGTQEYMDMLEDYFRGLAAKEAEGIMMAGSLGDEKDDISREMFNKPVKDLNPDELQELMEELERLREKFRAAKGGRANLALGTKPTPEESGLGGLPIEADMRYTGGFMPYGAKEKADDVPARLSKNEFVFTADAVRAAGGGSVNEGAKKMYATMKQLEAKPEAKRNDGIMANGDVTQTTITQAPEYLRPGIEKFLELSTAQAAQPMDTSKFAPSVVGLGALQQQAQQQAATQAGLGTLQFDPTTGAVSGVTGTGVAGFQPFLTDAQTTLGGVSPMIQAAATRTGPTAFQAFESPYQTAVRDATLASFDEQAAARRQGISDTAAQLGALGAGRTGVQLAEYDRKSDMDRALLQAQLNQAGFTQANQLAAQAFAQQGQLAGLQSGLANQQLGFATAQPQLAAGAIGMAQGLGQSDLAFRQAIQDAQTQANRMAAFEPIDRLARFGQGLTGVGGGLGSVQTMTGPAAPTPSPLSNALTAGIGAFSLGKLFG